MNNSTENEEDYYILEDDNLSSTDNALFTVYCMILIVGVLANAGLALSVLTQQTSKLHGGGGLGGRIRSRSPLLLGLCAADLLVCCISAPLTVCFAVMTHRPWPFAPQWCKIAFFLQALPVAASTLSLMLVSVDRYLTVKYPRPVVQLQDNSCSHGNTFAAVGAWAIGFLASCPILVVRRIPPNSGKCVEIWSSAEWRYTYLVFWLLIVYVIPSIMVLACHIGVRKKLTALSLTARAAHGELPLPVPLLRKPAHVIIVAGLANNTDNKVMTYPHEGEESSDEENFEDKLRNFNMNTRRKPMGPPKRNRKRQMSHMRRATKTEQEIREENRRLRPHQDAPLSNATTRGRSTLQSRRRLANALVSAAALFVGCWLPHIVCTVCAELCSLQSVQLKQAAQYSLLLGHAHSAINPVVYWALNHQSLQSTCECLSRIRLPHAYKNASSTNEAALGPFHPRYTRPHANANPLRRQSSCYLY